MAAASSAPSLEILVREPHVSSVWIGPPFENGQPEIKLEKMCSSATFSEDGSRLMVIKPESVVSIYDCRNYAELRSFELPNLVAASLSPCGTYLQTFQKSTTPQEKNVNLWEVESGASVHSLFQKNMTKATWPSIMFSSDEVLACHLATNEIQFFDPKNFSKGTVSRRRIPGVVAIKLSKQPGSHVAAYVPEAKGVPASVQIFACGGNVSSEPLARRNFFRCSQVQFHWNNGSTGLLFVAQSDVDKTNQSYYGESKLHYLTTDGTHAGLVSLGKDGPVHDVQWSYTGAEFAVVYGCILLSAVDLNCLYKFLFLEEDVRSRIQRGWQKWRAASGVLCDRKVPLKLKGKFYRSVIRPAILYGAECWPTTKAQEQKLAVAEMRMLRWMCGHTRMDKIRNEEIRSKLGVASIGDKLREARLRWFGHVQRRSPAATVRRCEDLNLGAFKRDRGRPKKRWMDSIKQDIGLLGISVDLAQCRERIRVLDS